MKKIEDFKETDDIKRAVALVNTAMESNTRVGRIIGNPGTGKSAITKYLELTMDVIRVIPWAKITRKTLVGLVAEKVGVSKSQSQDSMMTDIRDILVGQRITIIIDECNHLNWAHLEILRYFSDECEATLILSGTQLFEELFNMGKSKVYLEQLKGRIGQKQIHLNPMSVKEMAAYVIQPKVDERITQSLAKEFYKFTGKGNWRAASELMDACLRVMKTNETESLTQDVILAAVATMGSC